MRAYIAYRFSGNNKSRLKKNLIELSRVIENTGNQTYIFYRDAQDWGKIEVPDKKIMSMALGELKRSDVVFLYVDSNEKSEGLSLEAGYAKALNKKIQSFFYLNRSLTL